MIPRLTASISHRLQSVTSNCDISHTYPFVYLLPYSVCYTVVMATRSMRTEVLPVVRFMCVFVSHFD